MFVAAALVAMATSRLIALVEAGATRAVEPLAMMIPRFGNATHALFEQADKIEELLNAPALACFSRIVFDSFSEQLTAM
jgi:hypothetical protein